MKLTARILTLFLLFGLAFPALAQDADEKKANQYVNKLDSVQAKLNKVISDLMRAQQTLNSINARMEQTYMSGQRVLFQDDFENAEALIAPIRPEVQRLEKEIEMLMQQPVAHKKTHAKAKQFAHEVEVLERKFKSGKSLSEVGKEIEEWTNKTVNEMRLSRAEDFKGVELTAIRNMVKTTSEVDRIMESLKKMSTELLSATQPAG